MYRYAIKPQSDREKRLRRYVGLGLNNEEISRLLQIDNKTVKKSLKRLGIERGNEDAQ